MTTKLLRIGGCGMASPVAIGLGIMLVFGVVGIGAILFSALILKAAASMAGIANRGYGVCLTATIIDIVLSGLSSVVVMHFGVLVGYLLLAVLIKALMGATWGQAFLAGIIVYVIGIVIAAILIFAAIFLGLLGAAKLGMA